jgi:hypothetical protein
LSEYIGASGKLKGNALNKYRSQIAARVAAVNAEYSALAVLSAIFGCFFERQGIGPPARR